MHDDERIALHGAITMLANAVVKMHDWKQCYLRRIGRPDICVPCFALRCTDFIRAGINAQENERLENAR